MAQRFALYVQAAGGVPVTMKHTDFRRYAVALQQQYQRLIDEHGREQIRQARIAARAQIKRVTLRVAAQGLIPEVRHVPPKSHRKNFQRAKSSGTEHNSPVLTRAVHSSEVGIVQNTNSRKKDIYKCRRKLAHPDYLSALRHASRLSLRHDEVPINIYPCIVCGWLPVGHAPKRAVAQILPEI